MAPVLLSICIPTYNRLSYLRGVVEALGALRSRIATEIVISDDASHDGTPAFLDGLAARDPSIRVLHQPRRLGGFANTAFVLRAARGRYAVYHGDDDRLEHAAVLEIIDWLEQHDEYAAFYAPVDSYDLATDRSLGTGRHTAQIMDFDHRTRCELAAYVSLGLTPEHAIYRSPCLRQASYDARIYWSLGLLDAALAAGKVRFGPKPYYRAIQSHWPGEQRPQLGTEVMADLITWETFRAGLELIVARQPGITEQPARLQDVRSRIAASITERQAASVDYLVAHGRWTEFVHSYRVLAARQGLPHAFAASDLRHIALRAIAAILHEQTALSACRRIVLVGVPADQATIAEMLRAAGVPEVVVAADATAATAVGDDCLFLARDHGIASDLQARGAAGFTVFDLAALLRDYDVGGPN